MTVLFSNFVQSDRCLERTVRGVGRQHEWHHRHHDGDRTGHDQEHRVRPEASRGHHTRRHSSEHANNVGLAHGHIQVNYKIKSSDWSDC